MAYFGPFKCCSLRIFVFAIGILFLLVQTTFLIVTFVLMRDIETHVENWFNWMTSKGIPISNYWIIKVSLYIWDRQTLFKKFEIIWRVQVGLNTLGYK